MSKAWAKGSTRLWRKRRAQVLQRDGYRCQIKLPGTWTVRTYTGRKEQRRCLGRADCVHHIHGKAVTGDDPRHLAAACTPCNLKVRQPTPDPKPKPRTQW